QRRRYVLLVPALLYVGVLGFQRSQADDRSQAAAQPSAHPPAGVHCGDLATDARHGLAGNPVVKSVTGQIIAASGANASYCQVDLLFGTNPAKNINIRIGLPLNAADGGTGGVQGAWNGRTQGVGGGGCAGNLNVNAPVNAGYVGSGTDLGHTGGDCEP